MTTRQPRWQRMQDALHSATASALQRARCLQAPAAIVLPALLQAG
jgi:hypothetical protein